MTDAERAMWRLLKECVPEGRWRKQVPLRHCYVDFASRQKKLVIEVDGGQHSEERDAARTAIIEAEGYRVLRFWNNEVLTNMDGVLEVIGAALQGTEEQEEQDPHPSPLPRAGEGEEGRGG